MPTIVGMKKSTSHTELLRTFGALLKKLRTDRKLSQEALAEAAGVERNYIYYLERGDSAPTLIVLMGLAQGLKLTLSEFAMLIEDATKSG